MHKDTQTRNCHTHLSTAQWAQREGSNVRGRVGWRENGEAGWGWRRRRRKTDGREVCVCVCRRRDLFLIDLPRAPRPPTRVIIGRFSWSALFMERMCHSFSFPPPRARSARTVYFLPPTYKYCSSARGLGAQIFIETVTEKTNLRLLLKPWITVPLSICFSRHPRPLAICPL